MDPVGDREIPALDDAAYIRDLLDGALRASATGQEGGYTHVLVPPDVEAELVEKLVATIPFPTRIRGEWREPTRRERIRWAVQNARFRVRRWIHRRLFPQEARELEAYENEVR